MAIDIRFVKAATDLELRSSFGINKQQYYEVLEETQRHWIISDSGSIRIFPKACFVESKNWKKGI